MRKIDLAPYTFKDVSIDMKPLLDQVINAGTHTPTELFKRVKLAEKVAKAQDLLYLEESDWQTVKAAIDGIGSAFTPVHVEFLTRILEAPQVDVQEKV